MDTPYKQIQVIVNPASGQPQPTLHILNKVFQEYPAVDWDLKITRQAGDGQRFATEAAAAGVDLVVACGGDGTVMEVACGLVHTQVPLMPLPGGTNNVLAAEFNVPLVLEEAVRQIFHRVPQPTDLAQIGSQYFMLRAEVGLTAVMNEATTRELKDRYGALAYAIGAVRALGQTVRTRYRLIVDTEVIEIEGINCNVVNASRLNSVTGLTYSLSVTPNDGLLDVFIFDNTPDSVGAALVRLLRLDESWGVYHWQGRDITIETEIAQDIWCDGEPCGSTPAMISAVPGAVQVLSLPTS